VGFFSKAKTPLIVIIGVFIVVVDFRLFFMSFLADALLVGLLFLVVWKFPKGQDKE